MAGCQPDDRWIGGWLAYSLSPAEPAAPGALDADGYAPERFDRAAVGGAGNQTSRYATDFGGRRQFARRVGGGGLSLSFRPGDKYGFGHVPRRRVCHFYLLSA